MQQDSLKLTKNSITVVLLSLLLHLALLVILALAVSAYFYIPGTGYKDSYFEPIIWSFTPESLMLGPVDWVICFISGFCCSLLSKNGAWLVNTALFIMLVFLIQLISALISADKLPSFTIYTLVFYLSIFLGACVKQCFKT